MDPGGLEIFPAVFSAISGELNPESIKCLFASHQGPDIISSLGLWVDFNPSTRCYLSWLWCSFGPHFGGEADTLCRDSRRRDGSAVGESDAGGRAGPLSAFIGQLQPVRQEGEDTVQRRRRRRLAAGRGCGPVREEFRLPYRPRRRLPPPLDGIGRGQAPSGCERVSGLQIDMLCPQHGAIYQGRDVERFINWFAELEVGAGIK